MDAPRKTKDAVSEGEKNNYKGVKGSMKAERDKFRMGPQSCVKNEDGDDNGNLKSFMKANLRVLQVLSGLW